MKYGNLNSNETLIFMLCRNNNSVIILRMPLTLEHGRGKWQNSMQCGLSCQFLRGHAVMQTHIQCSRYKPTSRPAPRPIDSRLSTGWAKKVSRKLLSISSPNINQFSIFFHQHILWKICSKDVVK